ncbi:MAG: sugar phosphate isomerase/epimerase [Lachnospiraceae bacterium]|nr:sugar phosphate isomerase/epimerase [Lachnospiraceae bacterium]
MREYKISGFADEIADDLTTQLTVLRKLNMKHMEMRGVDGDNLVFHNDDKVKEIKKRLDEAGVTLSALGTPFGKIGIEDSFDKHFEEFKRGVEVAHMMDCKNIRMFSFYIPTENRAENLVKFEGEVFDRIGRFVDYAKANDVVLLHENEKEIYGEMAKECRKLMDTFYCDNFKSIFDFANYVQAGQDTLEAYELMKDYTVYIHVKDANKADGSVVPAGYGDGNVAKILGMLFANGFDGFLSLEPHLFNFSGFAALERDGISMQKKGSDVMSGPESFETAYNALNKILRELK